MIGIRELARELDLSIGTVSRALNDRGEVNAETRRRVLEAAARLGYSPNQSGRSLRRGRTDLVAMIVPSGPDDTVINTVFASVLNGVKRRLGEHGFDLALFLEDGDADRLGALRRVTERGVADALIIADTESADPRVDYLLKRKKPFAAFGRTRNAARHAWVDPDFDSSVEGAVAHLAGLGHERIGLVLPDRAVHFVAVIEDGFRRALAARGLPFDDRLRLRKPAGERGGVEAAEALLSVDASPTAAIVTDSMHAVALYRGLAERGLRPGRDLSILALLPEAKAQYLLPKLTTWQTDWTAIGERLGDAVETELRIASGETAADGAPPRRVQALAPTALSDGESVSRPRALEGASPGQRRG
ncbi:LacI family DNA-binding transcriptional regulator [Roseiarcus fermentans]|uniref:LacI family DNA-binding transcriptional regulator n=1 Tax=Roseiarcus fermentans TaxID=1473586 RepID=UPI0014729DD5|nr:LacI family DNA-binding transcriptional regulator [Roseiarcus fermentans]